MPSSSTSKRKRMRQNRNPIWLATLNQCLWHIHRSSSILFLCLVLLNGLAGVLSSIERNKLAEELRKKVATNLTTSSEEEEITRQILALFDYDGEGENGINETTIHEGNSTAEMNKYNSSLTKLEIGFSEDLAANNVQNGIIFNNLTMNGENGTMEEIEMTISTTKNTLEQTTSMDGILEQNITIERINNNTNINKLNQNETMIMEDNINNNSTMNYFGNETTTPIDNLQIMAEINTTSTTIIQQIGNGTTNNEQQIKEETTTPMIDTQIVVEIDENLMNKSMENEGNVSTTTMTMSTAAIVGKEINETESDIEQKIEEINNNLVEDESIGNKGVIAKEDENAMKMAIEQIQQKEKELNEFDVGQLREYREHLKRILANVENILTNKGPTPVQMSDFSKTKRFIAISSSLPNWESALLMNRKNALSASVDAHQIRKSPPHPTNSQIKTEGGTEGMPTSTATTTLSQSTIIGHNEGGIEATTTVGQQIRTNVPENAAAGEKMQPAVSDDSSESSNEQWNPRRNGFIRAESIASNSLPFNPTRNNSLEYCKHLSQTELVNELKQKGTYNPELMAWDVSGIFRFLDRSIVDQYERQSKPPKSSEQAVRRNVEALEQLLGELNLQCEVRTPEVISRLSNLTLTEPRRSIISPSLRNQEEIRHKRNTILADQLVQSFNSSLRRDSPLNERQNGKTKARKQKLIGDVHVVPFGCDKRGYSEDGYLRLCGACQAIRKLPDEFFPPFINEVMCDEDKACLYFYDYPHGKCKQKHMNFVVLRNVGTQLCQVWEKFNLNVRVSCECFVDEMSFFAKYV